MMHQTTKLNSEILTRIRYLAYSIPLACIMTLLVGAVYGTCFISPDYNKVYAEGGSDEDYGIMPLATVSPSASLTVGGGSSVSLAANTTPGNTAYASTNVSYSATDTTAYTLQATYANGNTSLKYDGASGTTIGGAGGKAGSSLGDNTWGFAWVAGSTAESAYASQTYYTLPAYGTKGSGISTGRLENGTSISNTTKKIVFAAKFGSNATTGHYKTQVLLSLTATPKATYNYSLAYNLNGGSGTISPNPQTANSQDTTSYTFTISSTKPTKTGYDFLGWADSSTATSAQYSSGGTITLQSSSPSKTIYAVWRAEPSVSGFGGVKAMQDFKCSNATNGTTGQLYDRRDKTTYTVAKADGICVMTQNLTLDLTKAGIAIATESDNLPANYPTTALPNRFNTASTNAWEINTTLDQFSKAPQKVESGSGSYKSSYGYYYSWCAATGKTCSSAGSDGTDATGSICPRGWQLPKGGIGVTNDFAKLGGITSSVSKESEHWKDAKNPSFTNGALTVNGLTWAAAGVVTPDGLSSAGLSGNYWSGIFSGTYFAYSLHFNNASIYPAASNHRSYGFSVRCIAK